MKTKYLEREKVKKASKILIKGGLVCFPTETVYGVGVSIKKKDFFDKLVTLKKRAPDKPFALMGASLDAVSDYIDVTDKVYRTISEFLPGEVTFLVSAREGISNWIDLGTGVIGIRVPDSKFVQDLLIPVGPCLVTSANISGHKTSTTFEQTQKDFDKEVNCIVKGECLSLVPTTIIDLTKDEPKLVRQGALDFEKFKKFWEDLK